MTQEYSIDELIGPYVRDAAQVLNAMSTALSATDVMGEWLSGRIPATGRIDFPSLGHGSYKFHGRGCYFTFGELKIDIELCSGHDTIGFDSWRLYRYASETLKLDGVETEEIESSLVRKLADGGLRFSNEPPYFGLYFIPASTGST